jgi:hypothetical protein
MSIAIPQKPTLGYKFYIIPDATTSNTICAIPTTHQLKLQRPICARDESIYIALDSNFILGAYTADSRYPLYSNTLLYFEDGDGYKLIEIADDNHVYDLTTTGSIVPIKISKQAITINAIAQSYLAAPASGIQADSHGSRLTIGYPSQCRVSQDIQTMGDKCAYIFFAKDYEQKRSYEIGVVQLEPPSSDTSRVIQGNLKSLRSESNDKTERMRWGMSL